ncbi:thioredoxin family protein [Luteolibacter pohnpeiensis]|uniref:Thioredoxin family protein n=1 Tax=Luteolibacter pohnpeiensis TaxID=454153 RepID=A0A934S507_9BACT|nr:protein-disulfide reductase DsbD domain-containing protein [Luteolibacter pohnpeiensis]MBK1880861.1 thioredoxin family protein [Luteolibacter pohnpeiensis]
MLRFFLSTIALAAFSASAHAQFSLSPDLGFGETGENAKSKANLLSENTSIAPGQPFTLALSLEHPANWHSYYKNSGGIETPPAIQWKLPAGFTAGPIQWPVPEIKQTPAYKSLVYADNPVFLVEITPPSELPSGQSITLTADASWQICSDSNCNFESSNLSVTLNSSAEASKDAKLTKFFEDARSHLPHEATDWKFEAIDHGATTVLQMTAAGGQVADIQSIEFLPNQPFIEPFEGKKPDALKSGTFSVSLSHVSIDINGEPIPVGNSLSGIAVITTAAGTQAILVPDTSITQPGATAATSDSKTALTQKAAANSFSGFLFIVGGMFIGGMILNLMPCVFPVIGLKIMGFVQQAGHDRNKVMIHGLIFTLGVLISFGVLSVALFFGGIAHWGNQLQDPRVIFLTVVIMLLLGMNLFGVFEIGTSATSVGGELMQKDGIAGTFFSGVLATLVATPCSGPFLGVAIGAASTLPAIPFFIAFAAMALGLSTPYLVLSAFPKLVDKLPRPGPWMESFKQGMSFLLFAAAGVFLWVYSNQVFERNEGQKGLWVMGGLSAIACAAWIYGRWSQPYRKFRVRVTAWVLSLAFLGAGVAAAWPWPIPTNAAGKNVAKVDWQHWTSDEVKQRLAAGQPVYVDFTAKWCLTCQLNKARAYPPEIVELMKQKNIVAFKADKTNPDPEIDAKLTELHRDAIPVNVLYIPGREEPIIAPELLSPEVLKELFNQIP